MAIPQETVDRMMVKCGRRCCICRRFRPTLLQVHHIEERSQGGSDDEDNLIVTCLTCHTDVHSIVPFTRRFTLAELKGHRDELIKLVAAGTLPADETYDASAIVAHSIQAARIQPDLSRGLSPTAIQLLLLAANCKGNNQGMIMVGSGELAGAAFHAGDSERLNPHGDRRAESLYRAAVQELETAGLVELDYGPVRWVSHAGYLLADELAARGGK